MIDERGHVAGCAGVHKGVGRRLLEFEAKSLPFRKEGREQCCVPLLVLVEVVLIVIDWVDNDGGVEFVKVAGRDFA